MSCTAKVKLIYQLMEQFVRLLVLWNDVFCCREPDSLRRRKLARRCYTITIEDFCSLNQHDISRLFSLVDSQKWWIKSINKYSTIPQMTTSRSPYRPIGLQRTVTWAIQHNKLTVHWLSLAFSKQIRFNLRGWRTMFFVVFVGWSDPCRGRTHARVLESMLAVHVRK